MTKRGHSGRTAIEGASATKFAAVVKFGRRIGFKPRYP